MTCVTPKGYTIRLMLPARTRLVQNEAFDALKAALELEAYRFIERRGEHALAYKEYLLARELGITLPEAKPTYKVGLVSDAEPPEPVEACAPKDFPVAKCYRFVDDARFRDFDATNAHLLAALGTFETPFVPVDVSSQYNGYTWAILPTIESVAATVGKALHRDWLWAGELVCVDLLRIAVRTSDGRTFESEVCMAVQAPPSEKGRADATVYVTAEARNRLSASEIWYHLGGWCDDGDTYETQEIAFSEDLERFWADLVGPDEYLRQGIVRSLSARR